jgi:AraC-like DNA-binding protein/mannose-6-phosphate isomerase-like protein (cupin superfamily)
MFDETVKSDSNVETTKHPIPVIFPDYGITIGESHHERGFVMEPEEHDFKEIYYILDGVADCFIEDKQIKLEPENLFIVPEGVTHHLRDHENSPLSLYILAIKRASLTDFPNFEQQLEKLYEQSKLHIRPLNRYNYAAYEIRTIIRRILYEQRLKRFGYVPAIQATTMSLIIALNRILQNIPVPNQSGEMNPTQDRIQKVADYITTNFFEPISVENMARMACLSVRQFTNQFKAVYGVTFTQYLRYHRIKYTQRLLTETNQQIAHICFESGFNDLAHFYRVFKQITGKSPRKYRLETRDKYLQSLEEEEE